MFPVVILLAPPPWDPRKRQCTVQLHHIASSCGSPLTRFVSDGERKRGLTEPPTPDLIHGTYSEHVGHAPLQVLHHVRCTGDVVGHLGPWLGTGISPSELEQVTSDWAGAVTTWQPGDEGRVVAPENDPVDLCGWGRGFCVETRINGQNLFSAHCHHYVAMQPVTLVIIRLMRLFARSRFLLSQDYT